MLINNKNKGYIMNNELKNKNIKFINEVILELVKDSIDEILSSEWYGWGDCSFDYLREKDYRSNMVVVWSGDRGGIGIDFWYEEDMEDEEDREGYEYLKEEEFVLVVVEDDVLIDKRV